MIVILDNYDSFTYNLYQAVAKKAPDIKVIRNDKVTVAEIAAMNPIGIIISPGPGHPEQAGIAIELIQRLAPVIPMLGVCLGHQAIACAFGGKVVQAEQPVHGKDAFVFHHRQQLYENLSLPFKAGRYHSLMVEKDSLPDTLVIEAETAEGMIMGLRHDSYPIYGVQFHPESILTPEGEQLIQNFISICQRQQHKVAA